MIDFSGLFQWNQKPLEDFEGFSPNEMSYLLNSPFDIDNSQMILKSDIDPSILTQFKFFADIIDYLRRLGELEPLKLTQRGNLPRNFCRELYDKGITDDDSDFFKLHPINTETDSMYIHILNLFTQMFKLTKIRQGKISLTKKGIDQLNKQPDNTFFREIFIYYARRYDWSYEDLYPKSSIIQAGVAFSIFLVQKYGAEPHPASFYSDKYLRAFPAGLKDFQESSYFTPEEHFRNAYSVRVMERFLKRFSLIDISGGSRIHDDNTMIRKTPLIDLMIGWKTMNSG